MNKVTRDVVKKMLDRGWQYSRKTGSGHLMFRSPTGKLVTVSSTPSDHRAYKAMLTTMRRAERT